MFCGVGMLMMMANKTQTVLFRVPTLSVLLASHGGLVHVVMKSNKVQTLCAM